MGSKRDMVFKEEGQEYGQILKMLGNGTATVACFDGRPRLGVICGRMKNRTWINPNDIVLVSLREFEDGGKKCDIIYKYFSEEAKQLKAMGELPDETVIEDRPKEENEINLVYEEGEQDQDEEEEDDDDDLPPEDSDDEVYLKERALVRDGKYGKKQKWEESEEEEESQEEQKDVKKGGKPEPTKPGSKAPIGNVLPSSWKEEKKVIAKADSKKNAQQKKKDAKKKQTGGDSDSEDSKDKLDDI